MARQCPILMLIKRLDVGTIEFGSASFTFGIINLISHALAIVELILETIAISKIFFLLQKFIRENVSDVSPLYEIKITISFFWIAPNDPWPASFASIKKLEIPTEEKVLLNIAPTAPDFPVPEKITLPFFLLRQMQEGFLTQM